MDPRNNPDYGCLEGYAKNELKRNPEDKLVHQWVEEIRRDNPQAWEAAKQDFDIYKFW